jgi:hypothetical protein
MEEEREVTGVWRCAKGGEKKKKKREFPHNPGRPDT